MQDLFLEVLNMSLTAAYVIVAVIIIRMLIRKLPKKYSFWLWSIAAFRLCCPFSFQSVMSIFNIGIFDMSRAQTESGAQLEYVADNIVYEEIPQVTVGIPYANTIINNNLPAAEPTASANPMQIILAVLTVIWVTGMAAMLVYGVVSYIKIRLSMNTAMRLERNIYQSDKVGSPFILGIIKPKIYIPFGLDEDTRKYILTHEEYHLKRFDHISKIAAYIILSVHWFNPLCWVAFILMGTDMEMSCDEKVLADEENICKEYSRSLLSFAADRRFPAPGPLAFGETGVRSRIKNALGFRKPKLWAGIVAVAICIGAAVVCISNPMFMRITDINDAGDCEKIFDEIYSVTVINSRGEQILTEEKDIARTVEVLRSLKISRKAISRSENRNKVNTVAIRSTENDEIPIFIYFNEDYSEFWINDGVKPSFTYEVKNPEEMSVFAQYGNTLTAENIEDAAKELETEKVTLFDFYEDNGILLAGCSYEGKLGFAVFLQNADGSYEFEAASRAENLVPRDSVKSIATSYFMKYPHDYMVVVSNNKELHTMKISGDLNKEIFVESCPAFIAVDLSERHASEFSISYNFYDQSGKAIDYSAVGDMDGIEVEMSEQNATSTAAYISPMYIGLEKKDGKTGLEEAFWNMADNPQFYTEGTKHLPVIRISDIQTLESVTEKMSEYFLNQSNEHFGVADEKYTEEFFERKTVFAILVSEGDFQNYHFSDYVYDDNGNVVFNIESAADGGGVRGNEMSSLMVVYEFDKSNVANARSFDAVIKEINYSFSDSATIYSYSNGREFIDPSVVLDNGRFRFNTSLFSSYIAMGSYQTIGDTLILKTDDRKNTYVFKVEETAIVFDASQSSKIPSYRYASGEEPLPAIPDGARFNMIME